MGMGWKQWTRERLTSAEVQGFLMDQAVMDFPSAAARAAELVAPTQGMVTYLEDVERYEHRTAGAVWRPLDGYWGEVPDALPAAGAGQQPGDTIYSRHFGSMFAWTSPPGAPGVYEWHQTSPVIVPDFAAYKASLLAAEPGVTVPHNGFQVFDYTTDRLYATRFNGAGTWTLVGGQPKASVSDTALVTAGTDWTVASAIFRSLGNGLASVFLRYTRANTAVTVPANGDIPALIVASLKANSPWAPLSDAPLVMQNFGRLTGGRLTTAGDFVLGAVAPGSNIAVGEQNELTCGAYPLADPLAA